MIISVETSGWPGQAQQFQLRGQCRVGVDGGCGGNHYGQGGPGGQSVTLGPPGPRTSILSTGVGPDRPNNADPTVTPKPTDHFYSLDLFQLITL